MEVVSGGRGLLLSGDSPGLGRPGKAMTGKVVASDPGPRGEGVFPQGQEKSPKGRGRYLPRELRVRLYGEVFELRKQGLSYSKMIDWVWKNHGVRLSKSHISYWSRGLHSPYNGRYIPSIELLKPSEELAYVIGVKLGDGYAVRSRRPVKGYSRALIGLKVKDREFAEEFSRCLTKVLGRTPKRLRYVKSTKRYVVEVKSETLYQLLRKPLDLDRLKKYIEHCGNCVGAFLRGFFDSEGSVNKSGYIYLSNTDLRLLEYVKHLLQRLGIETTGPWLKTRRGTVIHDHMTGKKYTTNKDVYVVGIRANSNHIFYEKIGFTIKRKQKRLEKYLEDTSQTPSPLFTPFSTFICIFRSRLFQIMLAEYPALDNYKCHQTTQKANVQTKKCFSKIYGYNSGCRNSYRCSCCGRHLYHRPAGRSADPTAE